MNYTAIIAAIVSIGALTSTALGHPALAVVFNDPNTSAELTAALGGIAALVSAFSQGVQHPATSVTVPATAVNLSKLSASKANDVAQVAASTQK